MLSATGRKFLRGPRGTGFLYVRRDGTRRHSSRRSSTCSAADWTARTSTSCAADARRFETWERYVAGQLGLGAAADYAADLGRRGSRSA